MSWLEWWVMFNNVGAPVAIVLWMLWKGVQELSRRRGSALCQCDNCQVLEARDELEALEEEAPARPDVGRLTSELEAERRARQRDILARFNAGVFGDPESGHAHVLLSRECEQLHRLLELRVQEELVRTRPSFIINNNADLQAAELQRWRPGDVYLGIEEPREYF